MTPHLSRQHAGTSKRKRLSLRGALLLILLLGFIGITTAVVLTANGYRFDRKQKRIVATGAIAIVVEPPNTVITVEDGIATKSKQSTRLAPTVAFSNLLPGEYRVTARSEHPTTEGAPWTKVAAVEEQKTTWFPFVRLFPAQPTETGISFLRLPDGITARNDGSIIVGWDDRGMMAVDAKRRLSLPGLENILGGAIAEVAWLDETMLLVRFANGSFVGVVDAAGSQPKVVPFPADTADVAGRDRERVYLLSEAGLLSEFDVATARVVGIPFSRDATAFALDGHTIYFLESQGMLWSIRDDGSGRTQRTVVALPNPEGVRLLANRGGGAVAAVDRNGTAWLLDADADRFVPIAEGIHEAAFSSDGAKLLLIGSHEVSFLAVQERTDQPIRPKGSREVITRLSDPIRAAFFLPQEEEHAVILAGTTLRIIELDGRGGRNTFRYENVQTAAAAGKSAPLMVVQTNRMLSRIAIPKPSILPNVPR